MKQVRRPLAAMTFAAALGVSCATSPIAEDPSSDPSGVSQIDAEQPGDMSAVPPVNPQPRVESGMHSDPPAGVNGRAAAGLGYDLAFLLALASALTGVVLFGGSLFQHMNLPMGYPPMA